MITTLNVNAVIEKDNGEAYLRLEGHQNFVDPTLSKEKVLECLEAWNLPNINYLGNNKLGVVIGDNNNALSLTRDNKIVHLI